jgi:uncharacterized phage protein (TIGR02218 family)
MATTAQKEALQSNCTFCTADPIIKIVARDGTTIAYAPHTRYLTVGATVYAPASPVDVTRPVCKVGLQPDSGEFVGPFDDVITEGDIYGGKWKGARAYTAYVVDYRDVATYGVVQERNWLVGKIKPRGSSFMMELLSLSSALNQQIGEETQPIDRRRRLDELGISIAAYTHSTTVLSVIDRRRFTVGHVAANSYFKYGLIRFTSGACDDLEMEIKDNTAGALELQLPMRSDVQVGDACIVIRGYDGTRESAKLLGAVVVEGMQCEPDLPGLSKVLEYPA